MPGPSRGCPSCFSLRPPCVLSPSRRQPHFSGAGCSVLSLPVTSHSVRAERWVCRPVAFLEPGFLHRTLALEHKGLGLSPDSAQEVGKSLICQKPEDPDLSVTQNTGSGSFILLCPPTSPPVTGVCLSLSSGLMLPFPRGMWPPHQSVAKDAHSTSLKQRPWGRTHGLKAIP